MASAADESSRVARVGGRASVLLIEDDGLVARALTRLLSAEGCEVVHVASGGAAIDAVLSRSFDVVISDVNLPGASGVDVLTVVRAYDPDVPLVVMTGCPSVETAIEGCNLGVLEYLVKPTPRDELVRVLERAVRVRRSALHHREAIDTGRRPSTSAPSALEPEPTSAIHRIPDASDAVDLSAPAHVTERPRRAVGRSSSSLLTTLERAMSTLAVDLDPIANAKTGTILGFAARVYSADETLATESALVFAAESVGKLEDLRRRARDLATRAFVAAPQDALLFVNVHSSDLMDGDLYSPEPPLARIAERVVLQIRARDLRVAKLAARASVLRFVGFRLALADLDAGHECLPHLADLAPEYVKIAARLVRDVGGSPGRRRVVRALVALYRALDAVPIAEGVSTAEERDALLEAGCDLLQGPTAARHGARAAGEKNGRAS